MPFRILMSSIIKRRRGTFDIANVEKQPDGLLEKLKPQPAGKAAVREIERQSRKHS